MEQVFVGLGANGENPKESLARGLELIESLKLVKITSLSSLYLTEPQDYKDQPWFHNQVVELRVDPRLKAKSLLLELLEIEKKVGRRRDPLAPRFGPRKLDLDLLLYGSELSADPECQLPHPRMFKRAFVLLPLQEIAGDLLILGNPLSFYLDQISYQQEGLKIFQA
ncbi:MAG: 2-amino-4-hydroxy-6-hydroxymethyldihydropteridine diphosphokinase [Desulfovibrionaceae bacterium]|nr:2-amino-4-hydroxy-6-hydroxymethyldihydropteridine diphosphokinase [Desulfovibrionaceae bacterium]